MYFIAYSLGLSDLNIHQRRNGISVDTVLSQLSVCNPSYKRCEYCISSWYCFQPVWT
jgi:hypothetical protein